MAFSRLENEGVIRVFNVVVLVNADYNIYFAARFEVFLDKIAHYLGAKLSDFNFKLNVAQFAAYYAPAECTSRTRSVPYHAP